MTFLSFSILISKTEIIFNVRIAKKIKKDDVKGNEVLIHVMTWINPEHIMLSEGSQLQMSTYNMIPFIWKCRIGESMETKVDYSLLRAGR